MLSGTDSIKAHQIACKMKTGDLLVALLRNGIAFYRPRANGVQRSQFIACFKQRLPLLDRLLPFNDVVELIELVFIQGERDA